MAYGIIRYVFHPHRRWIVMVGSERYAFHHENSKEAIVTALAEHGKTCSSITYESRDWEGGPWNASPDKPEAHNECPLP